MTLAETVFEDLRSRLESGEGPPCKLTFSSLSQQYQVSLTPVREAIKELVNQGYLVKLPSGRLQVSDALPKRRKANTNSAPPKLPVDRDAVIRTDIIRLSLIGDSRYIREDAAAAKYGIGRTVLRPIFSRLAGQGLLEHVPRCGWKVRAFDTRDLCDFIEVREALELKALDEAYDKLDKQLLAEMLEGNRGGRVTKMGELNNNLHSYWIKLSGNRYIMDFFARQGVYYSTLFDFAAPEAHVVAEMAEQHCNILKALMDDDLKSAKKALVRHIRAQKPIVQKLLEQIQSQRGELAAIT
jgi:DNA-binding GntR family transcriptional regulator